MLRILLNGFGGQMGRAVCAAAAASGDAFAIVAGVDLNAAALSAPCPVYPTIDDVKEAADVLIDFSVPAALPGVLRYALKHGLPAVIGTTGLSEKDLKLIRRVAEKVPVFQTGNMSLGVNLQLSLAKQAAAALGSDFDVEIVEKHHRRKIDAPSGTALMLRRRSHSARRWKKASRSPRQSRTKLSSAARWTRMKAIRRSR